MKTNSVLVMFQETDAWQESCCLNCTERLPIEEALAEVEAGNSSPCCDCGGLLFLVEYEDKWQTSGKLKWISMLGT